MTADVELLPLPLTLWHPRDLADHVQAYARANVAHATAAKDAEIEALRAERDEARGLVIEANNSLYGSQGYFHSLNGGAYDRHHLSRGIEDLKTSSRARYAAEARAERLAEALRDVMGWVLTDNYFTDEPMQALARARAALNPTAAQQEGAP